MAGVLAFDRFELRQQERRLLADGRDVALGARAFDVLACLVETRDRTVTKEELLAAGWPGLVVEENNLSVQVSMLRKLLGARAIATIAGRGYRFALEVSESRPDASATVAAAIETPTIAVLPFRSLSADPHAALLAEGLTADVIALLARIPGFLLMSRASTANLSGAAAEPSQLARDLSLRYVVEGTLRARGDTVQVDTQLVDAAANRILWSGTFSSPREQAEDLQEGIARGVITHLQPELTKAEIALVRRQRPENLDAWSGYHQAVGAIASQGWCDAALAEARAHLRRAVAVDPGFALAHAYHGLLTVLGRNTAVVPDAPGLEREVTDSVERAVELDGGSAEVLGYAGCALSDMGQLAPGIDLLRQAIGIDPSNPQAHVALGAAIAMQGDLQAGVERMRVGMRISPRDRRLGFWSWAVACFLLRAKRPEEALREARQARTRDARLFLASIAEAAALARMKDAGDPGVALASALRLRPILSLEDIALSHGQRAREALEPYWAAARRQQQG